MGIWGVGKIRDSGIERVNKDSIPLHQTVPNRLVLKQVWNGICIAWEQESLYLPKLPKLPMLLVCLSCGRWGPLWGSQSILPGLCLQTPHCLLPFQLVPISLKKSGRWAGLAQGQGGPRQRLVSGSTPPATGSSPLHTGGFCSAQEGPLLSLPKLQVRDLGSTGPSCPIFRSLG